MMERLFRALGSENRLRIMEWLKDPPSHFPAQVEGDLVLDGVCGVFIAQKLGVSQPAASEHLKVLVHAGLLRTKRMGQWTYYKRNEKAIAQLKRTITKSI